jgi:hypothetical protein
VGNNAHSNVIQVKFGGQSTVTPTVGDNNMRIERIKADAFDIELSRLVEEGFITSADAVQLLHMLQPVRKLVPWVDARHVKEAEDSHQFATVLRKERGRYFIAIDNKRVFFRGLDFRPVYAQFFLDPIEHPIAITSIISGKEENITEPYLNPELAHLETYFFYLVKILRRQNVQNYNETANEEAKKEVQQMQPWLKRWLDKIVNSLFK